MRNTLAAILLLLAQTAFADILYLKDGKEIKDAKIVKIGVSEVEYKIGKKEVLYTAKKSDIAIIFYDDGTKETFKDDGSSSEKQAPIIVNTNVNQNVNQNTNVAVGVPVVAVAKEPPPTRCGFTAGERWGTWFLNFIPGLGSVAVMSDWTGAIVQWGIVGGFGLLGGIVGSNEKYDPHFWGAMGGIMIGSEINLIWNSYRSYSYCKPGSVACRDNGKSGFNLTLLPTNHGTLLPAVTYNKRF